MILSSCEMLEALLNRDVEKIQDMHEHSLEYWEVLYDYENVNLVCAICHTNIQSYPMSTGLEINENGVLVGLGDCKDKYIVVPYGVNAIGEGAFANKKDIFVVFLSSTVTTIEDRAFKNCDNLQIVNIPDRVTNIGNDAFFSCKSLSNVTIPNSVKYIGEKAFSNCHKLEKISFSGTEYAWENIVKDKDWDKGAGKRVGGCTIVIEDTPFLTSSNSPKESEGLQYELNEDGKGYTVVGIGTCTDTELYIPSIYNGLPVTEIGEWAFGYDPFGGISYNNDWIVNITSVVIPDTVTKIGDRAFCYCVYLQSVVMGKSVVSIGEGAFICCTSLVRVVLSESLVEIGEGAFDLCLSLIEIVNKSSLDIKSFANNYENVSLVAKYVLKDDSISYLRRVGDYIFSDNGEVVYLVKYVGKRTDIVLPEYDGGRPYSIYYGAFTHNTDIKNIKVPDCVAEIMALSGVCGPFLDCISVENIELPNTLPYIGTRIFGNCMSLRRLVIPNGSTYIGKEAFEYCESLEEITIPVSVERIEEDAFNGCSSLKIIIYKGTVEQWNAIIKDNYWDYSIGLYTIYCTDGTIEKEKHTHTWQDWNILTEATVTKEGLKERFCSACGEKETQTIPPIEVLYDYDQGLVFTIMPDRTTCSVKVLEGVYNKVVYIPQSYNGFEVTSIADDGFKNCSWLVLLEVPDSVTSIGENAFWGCISLTQITIGSSVKNIGNDAFMGCESLIEIINKSSLRLTSSSTYYNVKNIVNYQYSNTEQSYIRCVDDFLFYDDGCDVYVVKYAGNEIEIILPEYEDGKIYYVFERAFSYNSSLKQIIIPDFVTSISNSAFSYCTSLTSITIGNAVTNIGNYAFSYCRSLTSITIGSAVKNINYSAFFGCISLETINVSPDNQYFQSIDGSFYSKDGKILLQYAIGKNAVSFTLPDCVTSVGHYAFYGCQSLASIVLPDSVTDINTAAFYGCESLVKISIPDSVSNIGYAAFYGCTLLTNIEIDANNQHYQSIDGDIYTKDGKTLLHYISGKNLTEFIIPDFVTSIGDYAFYGCESLVSIVIPDFVTSIGDCAFYGCESLVSIIIPNSITSVSDYAFSYCRSLTSIVIPNSVTHIGYAAFFACESLTSIVISNSVTSIGQQAFDYCTSLTIYCEVSSQPSGWDRYWNYSNCPVVWGYKPE